MRQFHIAERVYEDLNEIWAYIIKDSSIETADRLIDEIVSHFRNIETSPIIGRTRSDVAQNARGLPVGGYIILFTVTDTHTEIARVVHGARNIKSLSQ